MPPKITDFKLDEVVWVKLGSYPWWPARVAEDQKGKLYKGKSVHVIFFGDDTEAWCDIKKIKSPFAEHLGEHGKKSGGVAAAVEQAQTWISEAGVANAGGDEVDAKSSSDDDDDDVGVEDGDDTAHAAAATAAATGDEEQAATGRATVEADSESGEAAASTASADGAKQVEQLGDGGGASAGTGGDEGEGEGEDEGDQDDADDDDVDDDDDNDSDSELSLDDDSEDDGPAFEPKQRKSAKPAAKRKASARGAPSAKRSRSDGGPARRAPNENAHDAPVSETELRDAPVTELISLRAQADDGMSEFAKARTLVDSIHASRLKLQAKLDKVKKQEKQATKLQQDAKANIRMALKEVAGCKMTVSALKETSWGKTVKKLSKFEGDANISKVADAQLSRWKATVSVETDASVVSAETKQEEPQSADQGSPTPKPSAGPAADETIQPEPRQQRESTDSQGDGQRTESTVAPQEQAHSAAAPSGDAEAEAAASEKLRAKARHLLAEVLGLSSDCAPAVADSGKESVIARELEAESYRIHGQPQSMGYKMRFRTLKLALKENESLRQALLTGQTTAAAVARDEKLLD